MADRVTIDYHLPLPREGQVSLHIDAAIGPLTVPDGNFILAVLDKITEFARVVCPAAAAPELPAVLRGVNHRA